VIRRFDPGALTEMATPRAIGRVRDALREQVAVDEDDQAAYRDGYADGFAAGQSDGLRDAEQRMVKLEVEAQRQADEARASLLDETERLATLSSGIRGALDRHASDVEALSTELAFMALTRALSELEGDRTLVVRLCTSLLEEYQVSVRELFVSADEVDLVNGQIEGVQVTADAALVSGECRIRTSRGDVRTSVEQRLEALYHAFLQGFGDARA
jgi:flagellar biosynthesis/type III secretory pathway protein FliH